MGGAPGTADRCTMGLGRKELVEFGTFAVAIIFGPQCQSYGHGCSLNLYIQYI